MAMESQSRSGRKAPSAYRGDHPGSQGQTDGRGYRVNATLEQNGVVRPDELYTLEEFKQRLGISNSTMRAARRSGLRVLYRHKHAYVYGSDWIAYVIGSQGESSQIGGS